MITLTILSASGANIPTARELRRRREFADAAARHDFAQQAPSECGRDARKRGSESDKDVRNADTRRVAFASRSMRHVRVHAIK